MEVRFDGSILLQVPRQKRNKRRQGYNDEEWQTCDSGDMPRVWHQDVQDWERVDLTFLLMFREGDIDVRYFTAVTRGF